MTRNTTTIGSTRISSNVWKALDLIREVSDRYGNDDFRKDIAQRQADRQLSIPSGRKMMRTIAEAIAYSQGARSSIVKDRIKNPDFTNPFASFDPVLLARQDPEVILKTHWEHLKYIRFKKKIRSIVICAKILSSIEHEHGSFGKYPPAKPHKR